MFKFKYNYSAHSVTAGKFDKCLHLLSNFLAPKVISLVIRYVSLNIIIKSSIPKAKNIYLHGIIYSI